MRCHVRIIRASARRVRARRTVHVTLDAYAVDEPQDDHCVDMLEALPYEDRVYYLAESHAVSPLRCLVSIMWDLEDQYAFVGGSEAS